MSASSHSRGHRYAPEKTRNVLKWLEKDEKRKLRIGFSAGRFEFMARPYGIIPRVELEEEDQSQTSGEVHSLQGTSS